MTTQMDVKPRTHLFFMGSWFRKQWESIMLGDFSFGYSNLWDVKFGGFRSATAQDHDSQVGVLENMLVVGFRQLGLRL